MILLLAAWMVTAGAQAAPDDAQPLDDPTGDDFIRATERDEDPLGIDRATGAELDEAAQALARRRARPRTVPVEQGEVLAGARGLRESAHRVQLHWSHGVQFVRIELTLENQGAQAAEASYRLALPQGARVTEVRTCRSAACATATPEANEPGARSGRPSRRELPPAPAPALRAQRIHDERGAALALWVAPVERDAPVSVTVEYGVEAPVLGGVVRLALPARGYDPRARPAEVEVSAHDAALPVLPSPLTLDPWIPLQLAASYRPSGKTAQRHLGRARCGAHQCAREWTARPLDPTTRTPAELWVLVDRSPSMEGPARSRVEPLLAALLGNAPRGSSVRIGVFDAAADALTEGATAVGEAPLDRLRDALLQPAAPRTRLSSGLALALSRWAKAPRSHRVQLVVLSDGRFTLGATEQRAAARWHAAGIPTWVVHLADEPPRPERLALVDALGAARVHPDPSLYSAARHGDIEPLMEPLARIWNTRPGEVPTAGEQRLQTTRGRLARRASGTPQEQRYLASLASEGPWHTPSPPTRGRDQHAAEPITPAPMFTSTPKATAPPHTGLPAESVLHMLRDQLIPKARACLRRDRAGRADHAVHATFHFLLERREILEARVEGTLAPPLRSCLDACLGALQIPAFSGRFRVRYPVFTERATQPPRIELEPDVSHDLDRLFQRERPPEAPRGAGERRPTTPPQ